MNTRIRKTPCQEQSLDLQRNGFLLQVAFCTRLATLENTYGLVHLGCYNKIA